ncbi:MAG: hypothetical protein QOI24_1766 [Acidobacteriota bacterium]|jgi:hypothetical protein|nr:hypothetical protein [Acidobacteriota bacterium]
MALSLDGGECVEQSFPTWRMRVKPVSCIGDVILSAAKDLKTRNRSAS